MLQTLAAAFVVAAGPSSAPAYHVLVVAPKPSKSVSAAPFRCTAITMVVEVLRYPITAALPAPRGGLGTKLLTATDASPTTCSVTLQTLYRPSTIGAVMTSGGLPPMVTSPERLPDLPVPPGH